MARWSKRNRNWGSALLVKCFRYQAPRVECLLMSLVSERTPAYLEGPLSLF